MIYAEAHYTLAAAPAYRSMIILHMTKHHPPLARFELDFCELSQHLKGVLAQDSWIYLNCGLLPVGGLSRI